jgi:hypothetical protein
MPKNPVSVVKVVSIGAGQCILPMTNEKTVQRTRMWGLQSVKNKLGPKWGPVGSEIRPQKTAVSIEIVLQKAQKLLKRCVSMRSLNFS